MSVLVGAVLSLACLFPSLASAEDTDTLDKDSLTVLYHERPPYAYSGPDGELTGFLVDVTREAMARAGIDLRWRKIPAGRHLVQITRTTEPLCALGWFKNAEREEFATFSDPIYQDKPQVFVARLDNIEVVSRDSLAKLVALDGIRILVKDGYSYGLQADQLLASHRDRWVVTTGSNSQMLRMISMDRADFMVTSLEEASWLIEENNLQGVLIPVVSSDLPRGNTRHLICSRSTDQAILQRFNAALGR